MTKSALNLVKTFSLGSAGEPIVLIFFLTAALSVSTFAAQSRKGAGGVYFEALGTGIYGSFNVEYMMNEQVCLRAGGGLGSLLMMVSFVDRGFEAGIGPVIVYRDDYFLMENFRGHRLTWGSFLGLRLTTRGGLLFRLGLTPYYHPNEGFQIWAGLSVGFTRPSR